MSMTKRLMAAASACLGLWLMAMPAHADDVQDVQRLIAAGDLTGALRRADAALRAPASDARLTFLRGVVLMDLRRDDEAMAVFQAMTQQYPQLPEPYNNLASLHARAGRWDSARVALETALRNDPGHTLARENLGDVYLQLAIQSWRAVAAQAVPPPALQRKIRSASELAVANLNP
jgi:Flp pilus assembly protein TadD